MKSTHSFNEEFEKSQRRFKIFGGIIFTFILIIFAFIFVVISVRVFSNVSDENSKKANDEARKFGVNMYGDALDGVSCVSADTDGDGYVTCSLAVKNKVSGDVTIVGVECAAAYNFAGNSGCRPQVPRIRQ